MAHCQDCGQKLSARLDHSSLVESRTRNRPRKPPPRYKSSDYTPLPSKRGHIRILVLKGSSSENPLVECELIDHQFSKQPDQERHLEQRAYEAVSWCWGTEKPTSYVNIRREGKVYAKYVPVDLFAALKALRFPKEDRYLWIDAICINQRDPQEKSHQVEMMAEIYGSAKQVCIWLGEGNDTSDMALEFIRNEVLQLQNFDELCESKSASEKWSALLDLMQRPWFSRRWVVQEIALARRAIIYCGNNRISWKRFAVAVELFVEVETATHRLSEVMKKDPKFYHVPGWFEYVSALGASLLVDATGKLFRSYRVGQDLQPNGFADHYPEIDSDTESTSSLSSKASSLTEIGSDIELSSAIDKPVAKGQALLTLEYLVSHLSIFDVTKPHDAIYALLAISKDTVPSAGDEGPRRALNITEGALEDHTQKKKYTVDYVQPFSDVCKEFVHFCIDNADPTRALDIICRPWAPSERPKPAPTGLTPDRQALVKAAANGLPESNNTPINISSSQDHKQDRKEDDKHGMHRNHDKGKQKDNKSTKTADNEAIRNVRRTQRDKAKNDIPLPSWIPQLTGAAHAMLPQAGVHTLKMGRKNADTLVGLPSFSQGLHRNYNAAETKVWDKKTFRFQKRASMKHHSMYVQGFVLDEIVEQHPASQGGAIPAVWARAAGWRDVPLSDPPDEFWRTLVADRGRDGKNPPVYYARACKETFIKGGLSSGSVSTTDLINNERCSVVAQFCRRVQAVIWNRSLVRTEHGRLGLAGQQTALKDLVCILYGCSVPVVLRRYWKTPKQVRAEVQVDVTLWKENLQTVLAKRRQETIYARMKRVFYRMIWGYWNLQKRQMWQEDEEWQSEWAKIRYRKLWVEETRKQNRDTTNISNIEENLGYFSKLKNESEEDYKDRMLRKSYTFWKRQKKTEAGNEWDEPRLNWREFELFLRFGRRWKQLRRKRQEMKELKERFRLPSEVQQRSSISVKSPEKVPILPTPNMSNGAPLDNEELRPGRNIENLDDHSNSATALQSAESSDIAVKAKNNGTSEISDLQTTEMQPEHGMQEGGQEKTSSSDSSLDLLTQRFLNKYKIDPDKNLEDQEPENVFNPENSEKIPRDSEKVHRVKQIWCYYVVLGECYVHGMMDGEAMAFQNENKIRAQLFELR